MSKYRTPPSLDSGVAKADATRSSSAGTQSTSKVRKAKAEDERKREEIKRSAADSRKKTWAEGGRPSAKLDAPEKDRLELGFDPEVEIESSRGSGPTNPLSPAKIRKAIKEKRARDRRKKGN